MPNAPTRRTPHAQTNQERLKLSTDRGERDARGLFSAGAFQYQEGIGHGRERHVMMPARPRAPFEVVEPQFVFELPIVLFDAPAPFGQPHRAAEPQVLPTQIGEPVSAITQLYAVGDHPGLRTAGLG